MRLLHRLISVGVLVAGTLAACDGATDEHGPAFLVVAPDSIQLVRGDSLRLSVAVLDADSALLTGVAVTFRSSDTAMVTVSNTGVVRSRGPLGTARVTVSGGGLSTDVPAEVFGVPAAIRVSPADTTIRQGASYLLRAAVIDPTGDTLPGQPLTFQSGNPLVVTVSGAGLVRSAGPAGSTLITVRSGALFAFAAVSVADTSIVTRLPLSARPYGVAASPSRVVYVSRLDAASLARVDLPAMAFSGAAIVGTVPTFVTFDPAGTTAYVTNQLSGTVGVVDVATNVQTSTIPVLGDPFIVRVSPDNQLVWVTTNVNSLFAIDVGSTTVAHRFDFTDGPSAGLAFHPTNDSLIYASVIGGVVHEIDFRRDTVLRTFAVGGLPQAIAVAPDGSELYLANESAGELQVVNLQTGALLAPVFLGAGPFDLALSPDGTKIWVTLQGSGLVRVLDRASRTILRTIATGGRPRRVAFDPGSSTVVVANEAGWVDFLR